LDAACSLATKLEGGWSWADGVLLQNSKVFVPSSLPLVEILLAQAHGTGHEGVQKTLLRLRADFSIDKDRARVQEFVRSCEVCRRNKTKHLWPGGLLQPLPVPSAVWADVAMDFMEGVRCTPREWEVRHPNRH